MIDGFYQFFTRILPPLYLPKGDLVWYYCTIAKGIERARACPVLFSLNLDDGCVRSAALSFSQRARVLWARLGDHRAASTLAGTVWKVCRFSKNHHERKIEHD